MKKSSFLFRKVVVVGLGLIGGSFALELKKRKLAREVFGVSRSSQNRRIALKRKAVDQVFPILGKFVSDADLILLAIPVESIPQTLKKLKPFLSKEVLVTDVGSTKVNIVEAAHKLALRQFVGGHPIAGTEKSGMQAAELDLFRNKKWILTPSFSHPSLKKYVILLQKIGAQVLWMKAEEHDTSLAAVSHLPNVLAYALANTMDGKDRDKNIRLAGSSLKGMTRVASSPPEMWRDICLANAKPLEKCLALFQKQLSEFQRAVKAKNAKKLQTLFAKGNKFRKKLEIFK